MKSALPRGPCETDRCLAAKIDSPLSRGNFLTRDYPRPNCLLKCLPNCLSPTREGFFILFQNYPRGEGNCETSERQKLSRGIFFAPRHQSVSSGPLGTECDQRRAFDLAYIVLGAGPDVAYTQGGSQEEPAWRTFWASASCQAAMGGAGGGLRILIIVGLSSLRSGFLRQSLLRPQTVRVGFWQNGFFADSIFGAAGFFSRILSPDFLSSCLWEKVPRKILQENPRQNPPNFIQQKSPTQHLKHHLNGPVLRDTARLSRRYPPIVRYGVCDIST